MIRENWSKPGFWAWWWRYYASTEARGAIVACGLVVVAAGGFVAATRTSGLLGTSEARAYETIETVVTVREEGRTVATPVRVVRSIEVEGADGRRTTQVVTTSLVRTVPVVRREVVTRGGAAETVVRTRSRVVTVARPDTVTVRGTVTNERVVTVARAVTQVQTNVVTQVLTETVATPVTVTQTVTVPLAVTLPGTTITFP